jgi:Ca2+-binding EF-hand superfamily protein
MDIDGNGLVHWNEFLSVVISQTIIMKEENLKEVYFFFDRDNKGYFNGNDFKKAIADPYLSMPHANYDNVIEEAFNGKTNITFEEFKQFMHTGDGVYN